MENKWHKPDWANKHIEEFSNSYFYALEAVIVNITQSNPEEPVDDELKFLFNYIIDQGEEFTKDFLLTFKNEFKIPRLWLQDLKPKI